MPCPLVCPPYLGPPLHLHKGRHVAPRPVLALEGAPVLGGHDVAHLLHHVRKPLHLLGRAEALGKDQVEVALQGVAEAGRVRVAVPVEHVGQVDRHVGQAVDGAGDVLDEHGGAGLPGAADDGDQPLPRVPVDLVILGLVLELVRVQGLGRGRRRAEGQARAQQGPPNFRDALLQGLGRLPPALDQQGGRARVRALHVWHQAQHRLLPLALRQGGPVKHFHRVHRRLVAQDAGRGAGGVDVRKHDKGGRLVRPLRDGVVRRARHKAKRALGPDHEALDDLDGPVRGEVDERVEGVARRALDGELAADEGGQLGVRLDAGRERRHARQQGRVRALKRGHARRVGRIQDAPVREDDAHVRQRVVRVLGDAAAHAGGIVAHDAANHARVDRRGVRTDLVLDRVPAGDLVAGQDRVHLPADQAGLDRDAGAVAVDGVAAEGGAGVGELEQDGVGDGLC